MSKHHKFKTANFFEYVLIFLFGVYIRYLIITNGIAFYVNPRYFTLIEIAGLIAVFVGLLGLVYEGSKVRLKITGYRLQIGKIWKFIISNTLVIIALLLGFALEPKQLSTKAASNRASSSQVAFADDSDAIINTFMKSYSDYEIADWLKSFTKEPDLNLYEGIEVDVTGFLFQGENKNENEFMVGRFVIRCCVVDATPVGLIVSLENWNEKFSESDWLSVKGKFEVEEIESNKRLVVVPTEINKIDQPDNPYIY